MPNRAPTRLAAATLAAALAIPTSIAAPPWTVEETPIELVLDAKGRLEAIRSRGLRLVPKAFRGSFVVAEVLRRGGVVEEGEVILRIDAEDLAKELDRARIRLEESTLRLDLLREEQKVAEEAGLTRLERTRLAAERAERALERHRAIESERQLRGAVLELQGNEDWLTNQQQELDQLESMYRGTSLANETKDIVLERSRRALSRAKESLALASIDHELYLTVRRAERDRDVEDQARFSAQDLAHAEVMSRLEAIRRRLAFADAERELEDLAEQVEDLEADVSSLEVKAPASGILTAISLEPGDELSARQTFAELLDVSAFRIDLRLSPQDRGWLAPGQAVAVTLPAVAGLSAAGAVKEVSSVGMPDGDGTVFPAEVEVGAADPRMLVGLEGKVSATHRTEPVLAVPKAAVSSRDGRDVLVVILDGREVEREVVVGRRGSTLVEIVEGLVPGDRVVVPDPPAEDGTGS